MDAWNGNTFCKKAANGPRIVGFKPLQTPGREVQRRARCKSPQTFIFRSLQVVSMVLFAWFGGADNMSAEEAEQEVLSEERPSAEIKISGHGLFGNRDLKKSLTILQSNDRFPEVLDANFVEDSIMILLSRLSEEGYLQGEIRTIIQTPDYGEIDQSWTRDEEVLLPRPLKASSIHFQVEPGLRFYYRSLQFEGLKAIPLRTARRYFLEVDTLLRLKISRIFTQDRLEGSLDNLQLALHRLGFREAKVEATNVELYDATGAVDVKVKVNQGPRWWVRSVVTEVLGPDEHELSEVPSPPIVYPDEAYSSVWAQDFLQERRVDLFQRGYPDATASVTGTNLQIDGLTNYVDLTVTAKSGPLIHLGALRFEGLNKTRRGVLENRVELQPGDLLNRLEVDRARFQVARLGVFDSVELNYETQEPNVRDVVFKLVEGRRVDFHLLFGYGSYEMLRGGFELDQHNLFGLAHHSRLRAIQSFKASSADYLYSVPNLAGKDLNLFFNASWLRREEVSFEREEVSMGVGATRTFAAIDSDAGIRYNYEFLNANDPDANLTTGNEAVRVASIVLDLKHDRRDSPLTPTRGYKVLADLELASAALGGEVDYQRFQLGTSWHVGFGGGRYLHVGFSHGVALTLDSEDSELPLNKRYFPGGESSIRGYQQGEAAPRDDAGDLIGAETYSLGNLEFEQKLTRSFSLVILFDALGIARELEDYPFDEKLYTVGGGLRWKTIVGPIRVEYGHNLNPRRKDPSGTLHFSLGFPF